jgi:hypothetical protein
VLVRLITPGHRQALGGRPVRESRTPVNMGNQPHRDNGEAVVGIIHRPLLYPLVKRAGFPVFDGYKNPSQRCPSGLNQFDQTEMCITTRA